MREAKPRPRLPSKPFGLNSRLGGRPPPEVSPISGEKGVVQPAVGFGRELAHATL
jgi:hypothetical protein